MSSKRDCPTEEPSRALKKAKTDPSERTELSSEIDEAEIAMAKKLLQAVSGSENPSDEVLEGVQQLNESANSIAHAAVEEEPNGEKELWHYWYCEWAELDFSMEQVQMK